MHSYILILQQSFLSMLWKTDDMENKCIQLALDV